MRVTHRLIAHHNFYLLQKNLQKMDDINLKIATGKKLRVPSDDPVGSVQVARYKTYLNEASQYLRNMDDSLNRLQATERVLSSVTETLHRVRELVIQGANGTYTTEDRFAIAREVEQLLRDLIRMANTQVAGKYLFSGYRTKTAPFEISMVGKNGVYSVTYKGDIGDLYREIERETKISVNVSGDSLFFAGTHLIVGSATGLNPNWTPGTAGVVFIDKTKIPYTATTTLQQLVNAINNSEVPVEAFITREIRVNLGNLSPVASLFEQGIYPGIFFLNGKAYEIDRSMNLQDLLDKINQDPDLYASYQNGVLIIGGLKQLNFAEGTTNFLQATGITDGQGNLTAPVVNQLALRATEPHRIWLQDTGGFLSAAGVIRAGSKPPYNIAAGAIQKGEDLFSLLASIRDNLINNNIRKLSGENLHYLDGALENILKYRGILGAKASRIELAYRRLEDLKLYSTEKMSKIEDADLAEEAMKLKMAEYIYNASLNVTSKVLRASLVDYMR